MMWLRERYKLIEEAESDGVTHGQNDRTIHEYSEKEFWTSSEVAREFGQFWPAGKTDRTKYVLQAHTFNSNLYTPGVSLQVKPSPPIGSAVTRCLGHFPGLPQFWNSTPPGYLTGLQYCDL